MDRRIFNSPLSSEAVDQLLDCLDFQSSTRVLDVGCGKGEMLARIASRWHSQVVGIDPDNNSILSVLTRIVPINPRHGDDRLSIWFESKRRPDQLVSIPIVISQFINGSIDPSKR